MRLTVLTLLTCFATAGVAAPATSPLQMPDLGAIAASLPADDIGIMARFHFATHTRDFDKSRAFYRKLGYTEGMGGFPLSNTRRMAESLGMFDVCQYELVKGEVISLPGSLNTANIDLLQFKIPYNDAPPYDLPNHLGMAYAALLTTDLARDVAYLKSEGVTLLSEPYGIPGDRFVFFRDPDGVLYKLVEAAPPHGDKTANMHLVAMSYIGINVTDLERSLSFYKSLGYTLTKPLAQQTGSVDEARAWGLDAPFQFKGVDIALGKGDNHVLRLVQWLEPFNAAPPYPPPINHIGINRIALLVPDLDRAVRILKAQGAKFLSEIAPCCSGTGDDTSGIVHVIDPDGIFLELVGPIAKQELQPPPEGCPPLTIKMPPKQDS